MNNLLKIVVLFCFVGYNHLCGDQPNVNRVSKSTILATNELTVIEGFSVVLQSNLSGNYFHWYKDGQTLTVGTNNFFKLDSVVEGDTGQYVVQSGKTTVIFNLKFKRTIKLLVNGQEIESFYNSDGLVEISESSQVTLVPFIDGLPIRYTLDGSEPNERSKLYVAPLVIQKTTHLRAKIEIPETDSTRIKVLHDSF
jgi:hypothetical protein